MSDPALDRQSVPGRDSAEARWPRWLKVLVTLVLVVIIAAVVLMLVGGGEHGPERHLGSDDDAPPPGISEGHTPPAGFPDHGAPQP
jgi:hypothetical protein